LHATLATAAAEKLDGDPLWLMLVGAPSSGKTETLGGLWKPGAHVTSTINSPGALLSASVPSEEDVASGKATGGLLRKIGDRGFIVLKDFTSILAMPYALQAGVLAALREIYDGRWTRTVGSGGGQTLEWTGRIGLLGAVTGAWDEHWEVIAKLGDRFVLLRINSSAAQTRMETTLQAFANSGLEEQMREELGNALADVLRAIPEQHKVELTAKEQYDLLSVANLTTMARSTVTRDKSGRVLDAHPPEMPMRFAKQLFMVMRAGIAIGMTRKNAHELAMRCARDSMPPIRRDVLLALAAEPESSSAEISRDLDKPSTTIWREVTALHMLGLLKATRGEGKGTPQLYTVAEEWREPLLLFHSRKLPTRGREGGVGSDFSGMKASGGAA
jgi:hypothetical protein